MRQLVTGLIGKFKAFASLRTGRYKAFAKLPLSAIVLLSLVLTLPVFAASPKDIRNKVDTIKASLPGLAARGVDLRPYLQRMNKIKTVIDRHDFDLAASQLDQVLVDIKSASKGYSNYQGKGSKQERLNHDFYKEELIEIKGYKGNAMEVGLSKDKEYLLFNDRVKPNKDMHWAKRINDTTYQYKGKVANTVTRSVDGTPSFDARGNLYYTSLGSYPRNGLKSVYRSKFKDGVAIDPKIIEGIYVGKPRWISLDPDISWNGKYLFYTEGYFDGGPVPKKMNVRGTKVVDGKFVRLNEQLFSNINTSELEYAPAISSNGLELFFTRAGDKNGRLGIIGIYVSRRSSLTEPFGVPERIAAITGTVEAAALSACEKQVYYHRMDGGRYKVYRVTRKPANNY